MKPNVGRTDKLIRYLVAAAAAGVSILAGPTSVAGIVLLVVAVVALLTGLFGFCPLYRLVGVNTCKVR